MRELNVKDISRFSLMYVNAEKAHLGKSGTELSISYKHIHTEYNAFLNCTRKLFERKKEKLINPKYCKRKSETHKTRSVSTKQKNDKENQICVLA